MSRESPTSLFHDFDPVDVVALTMIDGFGPATARAHLERIRTDGQSIDDGISARTFRAARERATDRLDAARRIGARCLIDGHAEFPASLHDLEQPPVALWAIGDTAIVRDRPTISIVGTRGCTSYGERVTREIGGAFARAGATIVSGMAVGIDAAAHRAALEAGASTVAVLGTGVDVPYPVGHRNLHRQIAARGVVMSESPPGGQAIKGCFPRRNRIIAALGSATIVVEAGVKSGALNTADHAQAIGRTLAAVPGPIDSPASLGSNLLLRDGAHAITGVDDALALLGLSHPRPAEARLESAQERTVWKALESPAADFDALCARAGLPARTCLEAVSTLELRGLVECALTGELRRR